MPNQPTSSAKNVTGDSARKLTHPQPAPIYGPTHSAVPPP
jgi:hypothetical protein